VINVNSKQIFAMQCIQKSNLQQNHRGKSRYKQPLKPNLRENLKRKLEREKKKTILRLGDWKLQYPSCEQRMLRSQISIGIAGVFRSRRFLDLEIFKAKA
jgi:hypothetical protein